MEEIEHLKGRVERIPFLDPIDLRFRSRVKVPVPTSKAVMFCLMDVSGSMDESRKDLAKRFFILLYLFLTRHYEKIDIVFIRHHTQAQEVDEQNFFHATETGGTVADLINRVFDPTVTIADFGWLRLSGAPAWWLACAPGRPVCRSRRRAVPPRPRRAWSRFPPASSSSGDRKSTRLNSSH